MGGAPPRIVLRRVVALILVAGAVGAGWHFLIREEAAESGGDRERAGGGPSGTEELVGSLTVEEQVDQVLLLGFDGVAPEALVARLGQRQVGGVLVGSTAWAAGGSALLDTLRSASRAGGRTPVLLAAAQEGGVYRSFADLPPAERALDIGDLGSPERAQRWAAETATALAGAGFHLNLFPVADVATLDSPVADRAFSDDPAAAAELTAAALRGCEEAGIACAPLHFPGLGAASQDTSQGPATVSLDAAALAARDLVPFRGAVADGVPAIVLSLAFYSAYDAVTPAALVPEIATGLLRDDLGFRGVAITDDLSSGAVRATQTVPAAAVAALRAGADLIQIGAAADQEPTRAALLAAVEAGEVSETRLAEAAGRVLALKRALGLLR